MNCWEKTPHEVEEMLGTSIKRGLSSDVAEKRLQQQGKNTLHYDKNKKGLLYRFFAQLNDFMVIVLISASVVSFLPQNYNKALYQWRKGFYGFCNYITDCMCKCYIRHDTGK